MRLAKEIRANFKPYSMRKLKRRERRAPESVWVSTSVPSVVFEVCGKTNTTFVG